MARESSLPDALVSGIGERVAPLAGLSGAGSGDGQFGNFPRYGGGLAGGRCTLKRVDAVEARLYDAGDFESVSLSVGKKET